MIEFPTPTPWSPESTPFPTGGFDMVQDTAVNTVQWWNFMSGDAMYIIQGLIIIMVILVGIYYLNHQLSKIE